MKTWLRIKYYLLNYIIYLEKLKKIRKVRGQNFERQFVGYMRPSRRVTICVKGFHSQAIFESFKYKAIQNMLKQKLRDWKKEKNLMKKILLFLHKEKQGEFGTTVEGLYAFINYLLTEQEKKGRKK